MNVLISGAGIAGPTLAYWLLRYGLNPTIVERAPRLRTGGYIIDFWGVGFDIAERMGLLPELNARGYHVRDVRVVNRAGKRVAGFPVEAFARATRGRFVSVPRGDLAAAIFHGIENQVETIFGDSIAQTDQDESRVRVTFESGALRDFDLVIGADGLHSRVRELVFGEEERFEKYLGLKVAGFRAEGYPHRNELEYLMYTEIGQQVSRFSMRNNETMFLFTFADPNPDESPNDIATQKKLLRRRFGNSGWECPEILDALETAPELYFDRVSQIRMDPQQGLWSRGRIALLGDAASCVSLLAGEGSGLAMCAAYILAGELHRAGADYTTAFSRYQQLFGPLAARKQKTALRFASWFAPKSQLALSLRDLGMNLLRFRWIANLAVGSDLADNITLPHY